VWRPYSIANAPRADGLIELHVRAVPGGLVSSVLVRDAVVGDTVLLGPAAGPLAEPDSDRDLLCLAGGTGLAPLNAIIEQVVGNRRVGVHRKITLFAGARSESDLYDLPALQTMQAVYPGLEVIPVLAGHTGAGASALTGQLPDVVHGHGLFDNSEAYVCGPAPMVRQAALMLSAQLPAGQIHHDPLPAEQSLLAAAPVRTPPPGLSAEAAEMDDFRHSPLLAKFGRPGILPDAPA
jgi:NAD(P)H-flavin reductase